MLIQILFKIENDNFVDAVFKYIVLHENRCVYHSNFIWIFLNGENEQDDGVEWVTGR